MQKYTLACAIGMALAACGGGGGDGSAPPPSQTAFDLVFDNEAADGSRSLKRVALDGSAVQPLANATNAVRPHARASPSSPSAMNPRALTSSSLRSTMGGSKTCAT